MQINPRKTTSIRRLGSVDISALREKVLAIPEDVWDAEDAGKPNRFEELDRTRHLVFRFVANYLDWRDSYDRPAWTEWRDLLEPVLQQATRPYGYVRSEFPRVMLANMAPGGVIKPHRDANRAAKWPHKIHVPIVTNDRVAFLVGDTEYHFPEGDAVEVNNMGLHAVRNDGTSNRIHLIFEYYDRDQPAPRYAEERKLTARL